MFDEKKLREEIVKTWGEHGAHCEVFDMLLKNQIPKSTIPEQDLLRIKYEFCYYFENVTDHIKPDIKSMLICDFIVNEEQDKYIITIYLGRPGLLIGKAGQTFDGLVKFLSEFWGKPFEIKIVEKRIF
jgi:hypothetical protein